ncbi:MOSC domain-containing protein [Bacillus nakamurai]|uniref:Cytoplasmic protein n=1 Tax=Bacillus nakamurai TaxID=1793963 RepID=A0A150FBL5_9BACI|nr:MOSC domain-containing protein [Bacillus nakamurai]KXZ22709.1 cytoplasmic protein [Bacillus nakamurai]MED1226276.1 MOSC domain-containing protein [Bacillus nakamurai]
MRPVSYSVLSINLGKPELHEFAGKQVESGIVKRPAASPVMLLKTHFEGDGQADLKHHGGPDKAVCVYPAEHYPYWENALGRKLPAAAFGENVTVKGLPEQDVWIGDVFQLGEAVVQVSQPRQPCVKLALKYEVQDMVLQVQKTGFTGFYFRVLEEGRVDPRPELKRLSRGKEGISVWYANKVNYRDKHNLSAIEEILREEALSESWRASFLKKRDRLLEV